jgi:excinuclease UvrABC nuclease subunit
VQLLFHCVPILPYSSGIHINYSAFWLHNEAKGFSPHVLNLCNEGIYKLTRIRNEVHRMTDKKHFTDRDRDDKDGASMDNPEQFKTDKKSIQEMFEEEQTVDAIPLEDLKQEQKEEKNPRGTKEDSSSEEKFPD